ncbi:response regulator [Vibrio makurazakiensis]|uniref:response regulator n=1 Tax=Vibrio makurazakiensis TaxID=2910250 RepID=UPI003D0FBABB
MIIDDSPLFIHSIRKIINKIKVAEKNINYALDTKIACWYLKDSIESGNHYDIIICSYTFKNRPLGKEFFRFIEKEHIREKLSALIVTDNTVDQETIREIDQHLPDGFIAKPFNYNQLVTKINHIITRGLALKATKNAYFQRNYQQVIELTHCIEQENIAFRNELIRMRCLSLVHLKRFDEAVTLCSSQLNQNNEWSLVQLIELYSLRGDSHGVLAILDQKPTLKDHPRVKWLLMESELKITNYKQLISNYKKFATDQEKSIKSAVLNLYELDYAATIETLNAFLKNNQTNPLVDKKIALFLWSLKSLNYTFHNEYCTSRGNGFDKLVIDNNPNHHLYYLLLYVLKNYDSRELFKVGKKFDAYIKRAIYAKDNLVLILLALACYHLGLHSKVKMLAEQQLTFVENDFLSIITGKLLENLSQLSNGKELYFNLNRDSDLTTLVSMANTSPLNKEYHEGLVSQFANIVKRKKIRKTKKLMLSIESSISYLRQSYEDLGQFSELVRLKTEYEVIRVNL